MRLRVIPSHCILTVLLALLLAGLAIQAAADYLSAGGVLSTEPGGSCLLFVTRDDGTFVLSEYADYVAGDSVCVSGRIVPDCGQSCLMTYPCIDPPWIDPCRHRDLGCGRLWDPGDCAPIFSPFTGGNYYMTSMEGFSSGDTIHVVGWIYPPFDPYESCFLESIVPEEVTDCDDPNPAHSSTWGSLRALFR